MMANPQVCPTGREPSIAGMRSVIEQTMNEPWRVEMPMGGRDGYISYYEGTSDLILLGVRGRRCCCHPSHRPVISMEQTAARDLRASHSGGRSPESPHLQG